MLSVAGIARADTPVHEKTAAELAAEDRAVDALAGRQNARTDKLTGYPGERRRVRRQVVRVDDGAIPLPVGGIAVIAPERPAVEELPAQEPQVEAPQPSVNEQNVYWFDYGPYARGGAPYVIGGAGIPNPSASIPNPPGAQPSAPATAPSTGASTAPPPNAAGTQAVSPAPVPFQPVPYQPAPPVEPVPYQPAPPVAPVPYTPVPPPAAQQGY